MKTIKGYTGRMGPGGIPIYTRQVKKPTVVVKRTGTPQNDLTPAIETPDQIETRVKRMAQEAFDRERGAVREEADRLKAQAEGRRRGMAAAYEAAAKANAGMGADVQAGWEQAAGTIQGLAGATTGGISQALQADVAGMDQALSRVGAAGTGFDATSQAAVEAYRGGTLPAEFFTRMGGVGRQWMNEAGTALNARGLQEGLAAEQTSLGKIEADVLSQIKDLTTGRTKYEATLREQLLGARGDQIAATQKAAEAAQKLKFDYWKQTTYLNQKQAELDASYREALLDANTATQKLAVDKWYKSNKLTIDNARAQAYVMSQGSLADSRMINAQANATRAANSGEATKAAIPKEWTQAWDQYSARLDDVLDGKDPRFFVKDINGVYTLKQKYLTGPEGQPLQNAKLLRDDLVRLVGTQYRNKFPKRAKDIAARAYAKAFATWSIYRQSAPAAGTGQTNPSAGTSGWPSAGG